MLLFSQPHSACLTFYVGTLGRLLFAGVFVSIPINCIWDFQIFAPKEAALY